MKRRYFSRTRPSPGISGHDPFLQKRDRVPGIPERGSVTMTVLLLLVVFSGLGLAMVHASGIHLKINGFRRFSTLLDCASENGLKRGLRDLSSWLEADCLLAPVPEERVEAVRTAPRQEFPRLLDAAVGSAFPRVLEETFDGMTWRSRAECGFGGLTDMSGYLRISAFLRIESSGGLLEVRPRRLSSLEGSLGFLAGRLPLAAIPLYIKGEMTDGEKAAYCGENGISLPRKPGQAVGVSLVAAPDGILPEDAGGLAAKALNIGIFRPGDLSPARLREALGLEVSADPVPDGVYLIHNDLGLGGVFVQGDLDEIVLAIRGDAQIAVFRVGDAEWRLEWSPARSRTEFLAPEGTVSYDLVPLPILFVNGAIGALGGGAIGLDGRVEMSFDGEDAGRPQRRRPDHRLRGQGDDRLPSHPRGRPLAGRGPLLQGLRSPARDLRGGTGRRLRRSDRGRDRGRRDGAGRLEGPGVVDRRLGRIPDRRDGQVRRARSAPCTPTPTPGTAIVSPSTVTTGPRPESSPRTRRSRPALSWPSTP